MFEIEFVRAPVKAIQNKKENVKDALMTTNKPISPEPGTKNVLLKGQMKYISDVNAIIYLCSPM